MNTVPNSISMMKYNAPGFSAIYNNDMKIYDTIQSNHNLMHSNHNPVQSNHHAVQMKYKLPTGHGNIDMPELVRYRKTKDGYVSVPLNKKKATHDTNCTSNDTSNGSPSDKQISDNPDIIKSKL